MGFDAAARALRDAVFQQTGVPVTVDPDGAATPIVAILSSVSDQDPLGRREVLAHLRVLRVKVEHAALLPAGTILAIMDDAGAAVVERRVVQGEPEFVDARRLTVQIDTRPE